MADPKLLNIMDNSPTAIEAHQLADHIATLTANWQSSLDQAKYDGAWVAAGESSLHFQDDHGPTFKTNPYFAQWVDPQFAQPGAHLLIRPNHSTPLVLFTTQPEDYWHAVPSTPDYLAPFVDIRSFATQEKLSDAARVEASALPNLAYIGAAPSNEIHGDQNPTALLNPLDFQRAVKTPYELELMRGASQMGAHGHLAAQACFLGGGTEFEIHMAFLLASGQNENQLPYGNIVALNEHAATLHYQFQDRSHKSSPKSLLIDAGGQHRGYVSDITRTYAAPGDQHLAFEALLVGMLEHQDRIIAQITPTRTFADLHEYMHRSLCEVLVAHDIVQCSAEQAFELAINEAFCPHGLGHLLGIQVHDVGGHLADAHGTLAPPAANYPTLRYTRALALDQVFTIEPGLYFIDSLLQDLRAKGRPVNWSLVAALQPYGGIRIEDNVRVVADGVENLTRDAFQLVARNNTDSTAGTQR